MLNEFHLKGHDTTVSGITFCLYNIAKHPRVQTLCFNEIVEVLGSKSNEPTTLAELNELSYLELTIKESLRLFPSVPIVGRTAMEDIQLSELIQQIIAIRNLIHLQFVLQQMSGWFRKVQMCSFQSIQLAALQSTLKIQRNSSRRDFWTNDPGIRRTLSLTSHSLPVLAIVSAKSLPCTRLKALFRKFCEILKSV